MSEMKTGLLERGGTVYGSDETPSTTDPRTLNWEGREVNFEDLDYSVSTLNKPRRSKAMVRCRIVRNVSGATLLPKRLARLTKASGKDLLCRVDGYACVTADGPVFPIDEWLPSTGVRNYDLFYVVVEGPAMVLTDIASGANNFIAVGDWLVSLTGATTGATTSGRVKPQDLTGATALLGNEVQHRLARSLSAQTTTQTASSLLVSIIKW